MTFLAGLRLSGMTAPWVLDGAMDGDAFRIYLRDVLGPTLKRGEWFSITCPLTRSPVSARPSPHAAPSSSICRSIART